MKKGLGLACAATLGALASGAASAQYGAPSPPPASMPPPRSTGENAPASAPSTPGDVLRAAACEIGRDPRAGDALLAASPRSDAERSQAGRFLRAAQRCLRSRDPILVSTTMLRGAIAEAVYESQFAAPPAARAPALAATPLPRVPASNPDTAVLTPMYNLVDCATPRQPELARSLLATEPRSHAEAPALTAFNPTFVACLPAGTQLTIDPRIMRAFFAEALFRWSVVQRDGATSPYAAH